MELKIKDRVNNFRLIFKYPFIYPRNVWNGKKNSHFFGFTILDFIPRGWRKAFGLQLCEDIRKALEVMPKDERNTFWIYSIKEKWGSIRIDCSWYIKEIEDVISKYEKLSEVTCINCGKPAEYLTCGYILPYCKDCVPKKNKKRKIKKGNENVKR